MAEPKLVGTADDPTQIRDTQYRDSSRLARRANIHKHGNSPIGWFD